jgi:hypothetical protein
MHIAIENGKQILSQPEKVSLQKLKKALSYFYYLPASVLAKLRLNSLEKQTAL